MKFLLIFEKIHYIYFTIRIRGVQFRLLKDMWRIIVDKPICDEKTPSSGVK